MSISPEFGYPALIFELQEPFSIYPTMPFAPEEQEKVYFENQSRETGYGSCYVILTVGEPKARLQKPGDQTPDLPYRSRR